MEMPWAARLWISVSFVLLRVMLSQAQSISTIPDVYVNAGDHAEFSWEADVSGSATIATIVWRINTTTTVAQLFGSTFLPGTGYIGRVSQIVGVNAGLQLTDVQPSDFGTYECTVTLSDGTTLVDDAALGLAEPPTNVLIQATQVLPVLPGGSVTLTCNSTGGQPPPTFIWLKDNTSIRTTSSNILVINPFQVQDVGSYTCTASNIAGNVTSSNTVQLTEAETGLAWWAILLIVLGILSALIVVCIIWWLLRGKQV